MNDIKSIKKSVKIIESYSLNYALMHTTNLYPTPYNLIRLNALDDLKRHFPKAVLGLSDHTPDNYTSIATLGKGASIIEKHYTDKYSRKGVDIARSIDFKKLKDLIIASKELFKAIPGNKIPPKEEKNTMKFAFASVVAIKNIKKGEKLTIDNIWVKRPGTGDFKAEKFKQLLGKRVKTDVKKDNQLKRKIFIKDEKKNCFFLW